MLIFVAETWYASIGGGNVAIVHLDRDTDDFDFLLDETVEIDGPGDTAVFCHVEGVEHFMHNPPFREGELIGLLVGGTKPW